ncbi:proteasome subunit alpha type-2-like [Drosophila guanche]|uniref:Blast:Proteasome subunit alpha type-2 n=1 Tax=Drosophila guanche TaxID=7266 RepID=A0A3B0J1A6_DROGU|nr:proteasome subunit alpha type-2-like [Drosophila guanche]SPP74647.1 blast:Proteasome subunit alpha type-2 [Drosophila guanche]
MAEGFKFSPCVFNGQGAVEQSLYALGAVSKGSTSVGIVAADGAVIATATRMSSPLMEPRGILHVAPIDTMIGMTYSGLSGDFHLLKKHAQKGAQDIKLINGVPVEVKQLAHCLAFVMQEHIHSASARPFGAALLIAGWDKGLPQLYACSADDSYFPRKAIALGRNAAECTNLLEQRYNKKLKVEDAINAALLALKKGYEEEQKGPMPSEAIQMGIAYPEGFERVEFDIVDEFYADCV